MWQFGGETNKIRSNKIAGITCDQNYAYKDYPSIMMQKGLNGYKISDILDSSKKEELEIKNIASQVLKIIKKIFVKFIK